MQIITIRKDTIIKHIIFAMLIAAAISTFFVPRSASPEPVQIKIYFVDADMMRLMPVKTSIPGTSTERMAQYVLDTLIEGHDENPKIRRLIPNEKGCMTVKVKEKIAYVDIKNSMVESHPEGRDLEILTIYSIVNSLTELDGIVNVRFTIDGQIQKKFMGHVDMRETFIPDYYV